MIRSILALLAISIFTIGALAQSPSHDHNARHGMILFGEQKIYLDHIVYTSPHNYQVLLEVTLDNATRELYLKTKQEHPEAIFKFKSQFMDIKDIAQKTSLEGDITLLTGEEVAKSVQVNIVKLLYFEELPF